MPPSSLAVAYEAQLPVTIGSRVLMGMVRSVVFEGDTIVAVATDEKEVAVRCLNSGVETRAPMSGTIRAIELGVLKWKTGQLPFLFVAVQGEVQCYRFERGSLEMVFTIQGTAQALLMYRDNILVGDSNVIGYDVRGEETMWIVTGDTVKSMWTDNRDLYIHTDDNFVRKYRGETLLEETGLDTGLLSGAVVEGKLVYTTTLGELIIRSHRLQLGLFNQMLYENKHLVLANKESVIRLDLATLKTVESAHDAMGIALGTSVQGMPTYIVVTSDGVIYGKYFEEITKHTMGEKISKAIAKKIEAYDRREQESKQGQMHLQSQQQSQPQHEPQQHEKEQLEPVAQTTQQTSKSEKHEHDHDHHREHREIEKQEISPKSGEEQETIQSPSFSASGRISLYDEVNSCISIEGEVKPQAGVVINVDILTDQVGNRNISLIGAFEKRNEGFSFYTGGSSITSEGNNNNINNINNTDNNMNDREGGKPYWKITKKKEVSKRVIGILESLVLKMSKETHTTNSGANENESGNDSINNEEDNDKPELGGDEFIPIDPEFYPDILGEGENDLIYGTKHLEIVIPMKDKKMKNIVVGYSKDFIILVHYGEKMYALTRNVIYPSLYQLASSCEAHSFITLPLENNKNILLFRQTLGVEVDEFNFTCLRTGETLQMRIREDKADIRFPTFESLGLLCSTLKFQRCKDVKIHIGSDMKKSLKSILVDYNRACAPIDYSDVQNVFVQLETARINGEWTLVSSLLRDIQSTSADYLSKLMIKRLDKNKDTLNSILQVLCMFSNDYRKVSDLVGLLKK